MEAPGQLPSLPPVKSGPASTDSYDSTKVVVICELACRTSSCLSIEVFRTTTVVNRGIRPFKHTC